MDLSEALLHRPPSCLTLPVFVVPELLLPLLKVGTQAFQPFLGAAAVKLLTLDLRRCESVGGLVNVAPLVLKQSRIEVEPSMPLAEFLLLRFEVVLHSLQRDPRGFCPLAQLLLFTREACLSFLLKAGKLFLELLTLCLDQGRELLFFTRNLLAD